MAVEDAMPEKSGMSDVGAEPGPFPFVLGSVVDIAICGFKAQPAAKKALV
jgi:hypothetical protein